MFRHDVFHVLYFACKSLNVAKSDKFVTRGAGAKKLGLFKNVLLEVIQTISVFNTKGESLNLFVAWICSVCIVDLFFWMFSTGAIFLAILYRVLRNCCSRVASSFPWKLRQ